MESRQERVIDIAGLEQPAQPTGTYEIDVACQNCNHRGKTKIPKGTPVVGSACPNCGCQTVVKSMPDVAPGTGMTTPNFREALEEHIRRGPGPRPDNRYFHSLIPTDQPNRNGDIIPQHVVDRGFAAGHVIGSWDRNFGVAPASPPRTVGVTTDMDGFVRPIVEGEKAIGTINLDEIGEDGRAEITPGSLGLSDRDHMRALANAAHSGMLSTATVLQSLGLPASLLAGDRPAEMPRMEPGDSAILNAALNGPR